MLDLKIKGGTIVDGTGRPGFKGDLGVRDGQIVAVGDVPEASATTIDAEGRVVSPGFIDVHTHYDAQAFWDPTLSPSCYHGVTTIVGGFCGFSIAPITPDATDYIQRMLARVEGMPLTTLQAAVPWTWSSFGDFLGMLDGKIGLNAGFFVGHSAIRRIVMGKRAVGEKAKPDDLDKMKDLLARSLAEGALGFSTTLASTHNDGDGNPVPSRWADREEFLELARVVSRYEGTGLELLPDVQFPPEMVALLSDFSIAGNRAVNWNVMAVSGRSDAEEIVDRQLKVSDYARERGGEVIALTLPTTPDIFMNFRTGFLFDSLPGVWREIFKWPIEARLQKLKDPELRRRMAEDAAKALADAATGLFARFPDYTVVLVQAERNKRYEGQKVRDIAAEEGRAPLDIMLDLALEDDLETIFSPYIGGYDQAAFDLRGRLWADDRTLIGASDAGAHLDLIDTFSFSTGLLQKGVREHKVIGLERAIHAITQRPATYLGLVNRGVVAEGYQADLVIFDPTTVGRGPTYNRYDVPGGSDFRLYADATGIDHVIVNGVEVVRRGEHTGRLPGKIMRSGTDSRTVPLDALRQH